MRERNGKGEEGRGGGGEGKEKSGRKKKCTQAGVGEGEDDETLPPLLISLPEAKGKGGRKLAMSRTPSFGFSPTTNMSPPVLEHLTKDFLQSTRRGGVDFHNLKLPARRGKLPLHSQLWRRYDLYLLLSFALFMVLMFYLRNRDLSVDSLNLSDENAFIILRNSLTLLFLYALRQPLLRRFFYFLEHAEQQIQIERMPDRIILIRHGESQGNVDVTAYSHIPDNRMPLSQKGRKQAHAAGRSLRQYIGHDETVRFFLSPYKRTRETFEHIMESWCVESTNICCLKGGCQSMRIQHQNS